MNFQSKVFETAAEFRNRANALALAAAPRIEALKAAGGELSLVARRHASRFVEQNSALASAAGQDLKALARATVGQLRTAAKPVKAAKRVVKKTAKKVKKAVKKVA